MTTIFEILGWQQGELEMLFRQVNDASGRGRLELARSRFVELSNKLLGVMHAEDTIVYPQFARLADLQEECIRASHEHARIESAVNHIRLAGLSDDAWRGAVTRLQVLCADHLETEEWILFPVATLRISTADAARIGAEFLAYEPVAESVAAPSITWEPVAA